MATLYTPQELEHLDEETYDAYIQELRSEEYPMLKGEILFLMTLPIF